MNPVLRREVTRIKDCEFCTLQIELRHNQAGRLVLSICGQHGEVVPVLQARKQALESMIDYFEDSPNTIQKLNFRNGTNFRSARSAAKYVMSHDGEFAGLDVSIETATHVYVVYSCGQIREELTHFFPEATDMFKWHLNDMRVSPKRTELRANAWGAISEVEVPEGASWHYEPLPANVIRWAETFGIKEEKAA